jgi:hypothetical protein
MNSKQMTKALIEHELLWLIDNPDQDNVAILADWVMAITTGKLYDDDESLTKAYNQVFND